MSALRQRLARVLAEHVAHGEGAIMAAVEGAELGVPEGLGPMWIQEDADNEQLDAVAVDRHLGIMLVVHLGPDDWVQSIALGQEDWPALLGAAQALGWTPR